jgi:basic membrane protein A and related proteins
MPSKRSARGLLFALLLLALALLIVGCGGSSSSSSSESTEATEAEPETTGGGEEAEGEEAEEGSGEKREKIAIILPEPKNDGSFAQANYEGAMKAAEAAGVELQVVEPVVTPAEFTTQGTALAREGTEFMLIANGGVESAFLQTAKQFPDTFFCEIAVEVKELPANACTYTVSFQSGTFLAGALAGWMTKTGKVGAITGFGVPATYAQTEGFLLGAKWANPEVEILPNVTTGSGTNIQQARSAAQALISQGADILFSAADSSTAGMISAAEEKPGTYVIPQYIVNPSWSKEVVLTTVVNGLSQMAEETTMKGIEGTISNEAYEFPIPAKGGILTPLESDVPAEVQTKVEEVQKELSEGKIEVPFLSEPNTASKYDLSKLPAPPK